MHLARGRSIVIASHLGSDSDAVVAAGLAIARALGHAAILAHAESPVPLLLGAPGGGFVPDPAHFQAQSEELRAALAGQAARAAGAEVRPACEVASGPPDLVLAECAARHDAELVVVGAPRHPEFGTTADRLLRRIDLPVLVVRRPERLPPARVLAAVDLSEPAERALASGVRILERMSGGPRSIELLFALHPQELESSIHFRPERLKAFACDELDRLARRAAPHAAQSFERCLRVGDARDAILEEAARHPTDLILLGTHGRSGLERWILGSVAATVLRRADTNVLIVPSHGASEPQQREGGT